MTITISNLRYSLLGMPRLDRPAQMTDGVVEIFMFGPLLCSGVALLFAGKAEDEEEES